jgi:ureidoglycolate dehydrogenase (NAD+)
MKKISERSARSLIGGIFTSLGLCEEHVAILVDGLVVPSLRGVDTHGMRLLETYVNEVEGGRSKAHPNIAVARENKSALLIDADDALGIVAGMYAMKEAVTLARRNGIAAVAVKNSNHYGAASNYTLYASEQGMLGISVSNSDALVAPFNGINALFGTNPISFSAPAKERTFCLDMATSQISYSNIKNCLETDRQLQCGWAVDTSGHDSAQSREVNALQPLGGYKGQGLGMMASILSVLLTDMPFDHELSHLYEAPYSEPRKVGHFFIAIDIEGFCKPEHFKMRLGRLLDTMTGSDTRDDERIYFPGQKEIECRAHRALRGIPMLPGESRFIESWAEKLGQSVEYV